MYGLKEKSVSYSAGLIIFLATVTHWPVTVLSSGIRAADIDPAARINILKISDGQEFNVEDIDASAADTIVLNVAIPAAHQTGSGNKSWLRVIGLPPELKFSRGALVSDVWFIPVDDARSLSLLAPKNYSGSFSLDFFLMNGDRSVVSIIGKKKINVKITAQPGAVENDNATGSTGAVKQDDAAQQKTYEKLTEQEEKILLDRAAELMNLGTFAPARIIYEELANRGSAKGAFELAKSYDPQVVRERKISGMAPDQWEAEKWYLRAKELSAAKQQTLN